MRIAAALSLLLILATSAQGQDSEPDTTAATIPLTAYWEEGDQHLFEVVQGIRAYNQDTLVYADSIITRYRISILVETDTSYTMHWKAEGFVSTKSPMKGPSLEDSLASVIGQKEIVIETDEMGTFKHVVNLGDQLAFTRSAFNAKFLQVKTGAELQEPLAAFLETMRSDDILEQAITQMPRLYLLYYGVEFYKDSTEWIDDSVPGFPDEDPIPARSSFFAEAIDHDMARMVSTLDTDPQATMAFFKDLVQRQGGTLPDELQEARFEIHDQNEYFFNTDSGWILSIDRVRTSTLLSSRSEEFMRYRMLE